MNMKHSNIEWIGNIPADWEVKRFKYWVVNANTGEAISKEFWDADGECLLYTAGQLPIHSIYNSFPKTILTTGKDILVARNGAGSIQIPKLGSIYTDHVIRFTMKDDICIEYIYYSLILGMEKIVSEAIDVSLKTLNKSDWDILPLPFPPIPEQKAISAFLDNQCSKIDGIISKLEQQIEILKQYKTSLITETVTKGLNKTVPMKDSGIDWIGNIPAHWEIMRFKYVTTNANTGEAISKEYWDINGNYLLYTAGQLPIRSTYDMFPDNILTTEDDLLIARNGAGAIQLPQLNSIYTDHVIRFTIKKSVHKMFVYYSLLLGMEKITSEAIDVSLKTLNKSDWDVLPLPFPPPEEQETIATFLDQKCKEISDILETKQQSIETMKTYKKSLIYEYVTGKKRVV